MGIKMDDHMEQYGDSAATFRSSAEDGGSRLEAMFWREEEEPMQLGRAQFSPADQRRRPQVGECFSCGKRRHFADACPARQKGHVRL